MATIIRVAGADFSANPVGFMPPVADGLEAWHYLGGDLTKSARNLAPGGANAVVGGTPGVVSSHLNLGSGSYLQAAVPDAGDCTLLTVSKLPSGFALGSSFAFAIAAYAAATNAPYLAYQTGGQTPPAAKPFLAGAYDNAGTPSFVQVVGAAVADAEQWQFLSATHQGGVGARITNKSTGASSLTASALARYAYPARLFRIGNSNNLGGVPIDVAFAAIYSRALTVDEQTSVYDAVKAYMTRRHAITI